MLKKDRHGILLKLPKNIYDILNEYKEKSGVNINNIIYNAIFWWCVSKGLVDLNQIREEMKNNGNSKKN